VSVSEQWNSKIGPNGPGLIYGRKFTTDIKFQTNLNLAQSLGRERQQQ